MRRIVTIFVVLVLSINCFAYESKILKGIQEGYRKAGLPTFPEYAWTINLINTWNQAAQFVRSTQKLIDSYKSAYDEQKRIQMNLEKLFGRVSQIYRMVDLYDMDTWAASLDCAHIVVWNDCAGIIQSLNLLDYYTVGATFSYVDDLNGIFDFDGHAKQNMGTVKKFYVTADYDTVQQTYLNVFTQYRNSTLQYLKTQLQIEELMLANPSISTDQKAAATTRAADLEAKIKSIESGAFDNSIFSTHTDSLIALASNLVSFNMTEMQVIEKNVIDYEELATGLLKKYNQLKDNVTNSVPTEKGNAIIDDIGTTLATDNKMYGTSADQVTPPSQATTKANEDKDKEISAHDILHLQNAIAFTTLRQEAMLRDLSLIKAKTMSMVTLIEAYNRDKREYASYVQSHSFKMVSVSIKDRKDD